MPAVALQTRVRCVGVTPRRCARSCIETPVAKSRSISAA